MVRLATLVFALGSLLPAGIASATALHAGTDVRIFVNGVIVDEDPQFDGQSFSKSRILFPLDGVGEAKGVGRVFQALSEPDVKTSARVHITGASEDDYGARGFATLRQRYQIESSLPRSSVNLQLTITPTFSLGMSPGASGFTGVSWDLAQTDDSGVPIRFIASQGCSQSNAAMPTCSGSPNIDTSGFGVTADGDDWALTGRVVVNFTSTLGELSYQISSSSDAQILAPQAGFYADAGIGNFFSFAITSPDADVTVTPFQVPEPGTGVLAAFGLALLAAGSKGRAGRSGGAPLHDPPCEAQPRSSQE